MSLPRRIPLFTLFLATALASVLLAQSPTGTITGTVLDASGGVVPGAKVDVANTATGVSRSATSNEVGHFEFPMLNPGPYRLSVEFTGFKKYIRDGIVVSVAEKPDFQVTLQPGAVTQTVEVTGAAPLLETSTSDVGQVVNRREIENLPLNGRSVISLQLLSNGVAPLNGMNTSNGVWGGYINGGRQGSSEVLYDGVANTYAENNAGTKDLVRDPPLESVEEFKLITNSMSAEYGGTTGGLFTMVSRGGTNAFHGSLFEFLRNDALNATDFFTNREGGKKQPTKKHQFGGSIGGPIRRDKTFFFFHYEGGRDRGLANLLTTVPTPLMRQGDFSELYDPSDPAGTSVYSPFAVTAPYDELEAQDPRYSRYAFRGGNTACAAAVPGSGDGTVRPAFPGNVIPPECVDPVAMSVMGYYPLPNRPGLVDNFFSGGISKGSSDRWDVRLDHNFSEKQKFFFRFGRDVGNSANPNHFKNLADPYFNPYTSHTHQAVYEHTYSFSPTTLFTLRYGFSRVLPRGSTDSGLKDFRLSDVGLPAILSDLAVKTEPHYFPYYSISGFSPIGTVPWAAYRNAADVHTLETVLTKLRGRHSMKLGYTMHMYRDNEVQPGVPAGYYGFWGPMYTSGPGGWEGGGSALADFLIGGVGWGGFGVDIENATQSWAHSAFFQDDIKVNSKLTLNLGLRYDLHIPRTERYNRHSFWRGDVDSPIQLDPAVVDALEAQDQLNQPLPNLRRLRGGLGFPGSGGFGRRLMETDMNNFGPRFGFAYRLNDKTVVRGAFGVMYGPTYGMAAGNGAGTQDGFAYSGVNMQSTFYADDGHFEPLYTVGNPYPYGLGPLTGSDRGLETLFGTGFANPSLRFQADPYMMNWSFGIEHELPSNILVQTTYVANRSLKWGLTYGYNQNTLSPAQINAAIAKYGDGFDSAQFDNPFFDLVGPGGRLEDPNSAYFYPLVSAQLLTNKYPHFPGAAIAWPPWGNSTYNAFQLRVEKRASRGLSFLVSYTKSKLMDNGEGTWAWLGNHGRLQDLTNLKGERSLAANDISQRLAMYTIYELPFGRGKRYLANLNRVADGFLGGWQVNNIFYFSKGVPVIWAANAGDYNRFLNGGRPNKVCNGRLFGPVEERLDQYFWTGCFQTPEAYGVGSAPRTDPHIRWPGTENWDFSLFKSFPVTERVTVQVRSEFFNFTNSPQFGFHSGTCCSQTEGTDFSDQSNFGRIRNQVNLPREIQFGLRVVF